MGTYKVEIINKCVLDRKKELSGRMNTEIIVKIACNKSSMNLRVGESPENDKASTQQCNRQRDNKKKQVIGLDYKRKKKKKQKKNKKKKKNKKYFHDTF